VLLRTQPSSSGAGVPTIVSRAPDPRAPSQGYDVDAISALHGRTDIGADPGWTWPPAAPEGPVDSPRFRVDEWAPPSTVRHPWVRLGRFTLLYRRAA
jgi:hypothetical protein